MKSRGENKVSVKRGNIIFIVLKSSLGENTRHARGVHVVTDPHTERSSLASCSGVRSRYEGVQLLNVDDHIETYLSRGGWWGGHQCNER